MIQSEVFLEPKEHRYWHKDGREFKSWSSLIKMVEPVFDAERISYYSARKKVGHGSAEDIIRAAQKALLAEWKETNRIACEVGSRIHEALEIYSKTTGIIFPEFEKAIRSIMDLFIGYKTVYDEACVYIDRFRIAGTADKVCVRNRKIDGRSVVDLYDYKTNISKGIQYSNKYGNYLLDPLSHLEHCNYNTYCLQLSVYAYMLERQFGYKIGKLSIIFIPYNKPENFKVIPVPYMKKDVELLFAQVAPRLLMSVEDSGEDFITF